LTRPQSGKIERLSSPEEVILWVEYAAVQRLELEGRYVKLHGALVQAPGSTRGILLLGHSGAGKSTLGTALLASGWALLADDAVFVDIKGKSARPGPRRVALRRESQALRVLDSYQLVQHFHIDWAALLHQAAQRQVVPQCLATLKFLAEELKAPIPSPARTGRHADKHPGSHLSLGKNPTSESGIPASLALAGIPPTPRNSSAEKFLDLPPPALEPARSPAARVRATYTALPDSRLAGFRTGHFLDLDAAVNSPAQTCCCSQPTV